MRKVLASILSCLISLTFSGLVFASSSNRYGTESDLPSAAPGQGLSVERGSTVSPSRVGADQYNSSDTTTRHMESGTEGGAGGNVGNSTTPCYNAPAPGATVPSGGYYYIAPAPSGTGNYNITPAPSGTGSGSY